ncbi:MAG TPA: hypothetical protein VJ112_01675 [Rhabdochlamydiaceae bacterium]|nr:hypothetical protein [Rhabdochlamydiaceae bacterium]
MSQKSATKDERFLIKLYQMASDSGGPHEEIDRYEIGRAVGQNDRSVNAIARWLAQANFVKNGEGRNLYLTTGGLDLVQNLLSKK